MSVSVVSSIVVSSAHTRSIISINIILRSLASIRVLLCTVLLQNSSWSPRRPKQDSRFNPNNYTIQYIIPLIHFFFNFCTQFFSSWQAVSKPFSATWFVGCSSIKQESRACRKACIGLPLSAHRLYNPLRGKICAQLCLGWGPAGNRTSPGLLTKQTKR